MWSEQRADMILVSNSLQNFIKDQAIVSADFIASMENRHALFSVHELGVELAQAELVKV